MNTQNGTQRQQDVPASVAIVLLLALVGAWAYFQAPTLFLAYAKQAEIYAESHSILLYTVGFASLINLIWIYSICSRALGLNKQGKRLEILTGGAGTSPRGPIRVPRLSYTVSLVFFVVCYVFVCFQSKAILPWFLPVRWVKPVLVGLSFNFGLSVFVIGCAIERGSLWKRLMAGRLAKLPEFPKLINAIVLGAVEEG